MLKNLKIKYKILLLPSLVVTAFVALLFANQILNERNEQLLIQIESGYYPSLELNWNLELALNTIHRYFQDAIVQSNQQKLDDTEPLNAYFVEQLVDAKKNAIIPEMDAQDLTSKFNNYVALAYMTAGDAINERNSIELPGREQSMDAQYTEIKVLLQKAKQNGREEITAALTSARINYARSQRLIKSILLFCIIFLGGFSLVVARSITRPLKEIVIVSRKIASGNDEVAVTIDSHDEIGILGNAFNAMIEKIKKSKLKIENENWLKTGISELNDRLSGDLDIGPLSQRIIQFITPYSGAQLGAIFLVDETNTLKMVGSYAYSDGAIPNREFALGQGIVGQCALEKRGIFLKQVPRGYLSVQSGLGQSTPAFLVVVPFLYEKEISGVIELASFSEMTELQRSFLNQAAEKIAVSYHSTLSRIRITALLHTTQSQAIELRQQQEILQQKNTELQQQAEALQRSTARLLHQQEELQMINAELEKQTHALQKQRDEINQKNLELEHARQEIEVKARDLELTSQYKSEFLAKMSHELRTPLNSLLILSNLLSENKGQNLTDQQVQFARTIHSAGTDLLNLINDILDLSKVEAGKMGISIGDVEINALANSLMQCFQHLATEKSLAFTIEMDRIVPPIIRTDRQRLEQILKNLLSNAFKFTPAGQVTLRIARPGAERSFRASHLTPANSVEFAVIDTGTGVAPEDQELIFDAFYQVDSNTNKKFPGTGLGLSISLELSRLLCGEIQVQSRKGQGSTFALILPIDIRAHQAMHSSKDTVSPESGCGHGVRPERLSPADSQRVEPQDEAASPVARAIIAPLLPGDPKVSPPNTITSVADFAGKRILLVDDDMRNAFALSSFLEQRNMTVIIGRNGREGLDYLMSDAGIDLILMDIMMPGLSGFETIAQIREIPDCRQIPIIALTARAMAQDRSACLQAGANDYLAKPVDTDALLTLLHAWLNP